MAGSLYHTGILLGNTCNDNSMALAVIYLIAAYASLIMEVIVQ